MLPSLGLYVVFLVYVIVHRCPILSSEVHNSVYSLKRKETKERCSRIFFEFVCYDLIPAALQIHIAKLAQKLV